MRGEVKLLSFTEPPDAIFSSPSLSDATQKRTFNITRKGVKDDLFIISIAGITDRNAAELLKGTHLFAPPRKEKKKAGSWTYGELTGLEARLSSGLTYGKVSGVYNFGAGDIVDIEKTDGSSEMLPFKNEFIGDVRADEGFLIVFPPDYLESQPQEPEPEPDEEP